MDSLRIEQPPATLREVALERLRDAIIVGHFEPGERLVERTMCERLGVSRSVVREVLRSLESEGLIENVANQGPRVYKIDWSTAAQIYQIRALLESTAAADCAELSTPETVAALDEALEALSDAHARHDMSAALGATTQFYKVIFVTGRKALAWEIVQRLNARISKLRAMTLSTEGRPERGMEQLRSVKEAIGRHDSRAAAEACKVHLAEAAAIAELLISK